jgi:DNA oxidative demethylase
MKRATSNLSLFDETPGASVRETLGSGAVILRGFALDRIDPLLEGIATVAMQSPFRHMTTPGGFRMSVAMTNCGTLGWITDRSGYRYDRLDPWSGEPWPAMPTPFLELGRTAALAAGYKNFEPDACLINRYEPGSALSLHQDRNERDFQAPIVSLSLGLPATFVFGGLERTGRPRRFPILHGDVAVWGGRTRLAFHGIAKLKDGRHPLTGASRLNLTLRKAG